MSASLSIRTQVPLAPYTTLGAGGIAEYFIEIATEAQLAEAVRWAKERQLPIRILAGGSNVLVPDEGVQGLVIRPLFDGITYAEDGDRVSVTAGAGVLLDALVAEMVTKGLWGIENLSGIPGTVGATPVQNVGAYGVEIKDLVSHVRVFNITTETFSEMDNNECAFGYRDSFFKSEEGKEFIITHVTFSLIKDPSPKIAYKDLAARFAETEQPSLDAIRAAVLEIRAGKFPDWKVVGTAGSFFKNPIIPKIEADAVLAKYPDIPSFPQDGDMVKLSLGWILDKVCGLKGYREGNVGLYEAQALVLVCEKGTSSHEIETFAQMISDRVFEKISVRIEREVRRF